MPTVTEICARLACVTGLVLLCGSKAGAAPAAPGEGAGAAKTLQVGPTRDYKTIAEAAARAGDGDTVEVDAGTYARDVAVWPQDRLTLRAVGGRVRLLADGAAAEGKAIWVMRGGTVLVQGFDFEGTRVPSRNGAGIRFETGHLTVRDCRFIANEMGLLTNNDVRAELTVEDSEFAYNQRPDGHNHNLYVGSIAKLTVSGSYFHHATIGHLLKSRAAVSHILYNRLIDGPGGRASYELEFPNGGVAVVMGNVIQQSPGTENPIMISYGAEGYRWPVNALVLVHNTLVDKRSEGGVYLRVVPGDVTVRAYNNLLAGPGPALDAAGPGDYRGNVKVAWEAFVDAAADDYRLRSTVAVPAVTESAGSYGGLSLVPARQPSMPRGSAAISGAGLFPGALQPSGTGTRPVLQPPER